jgi:hypothetical protein
MKRKMIKLQTSLCDKIIEHVEFFNVFFYKKNIKCKLKNLCTLLIKSFTNYFVNE